MRSVSFLLFFVFISCVTTKNSVTKSWVNPTHLDHLYEEVKLNHRDVGAIWIYCEAPDYHLVGDEDEGFTCLDDVSRSLVFYCKHYQKFSSIDVAYKIKSLTRFIIQMQAENGYFYNFLLPNNSINKSHKNSLPVPNFWTWRALWALTELHLLDDHLFDDLKSETMPIIDMVVRNIGLICPDDKIEVENFDGVLIPACVANTGSDQMSIILIGLTNYYRVNPTSALKNTINHLGDLLLASQMGDADSPPYFAFLSWQNYWHAWGNTQAYALLYAGKTINNQSFIKAGIKEVDYFYPYVIKLGFSSGFKVIREKNQMKIIDNLPFSQIAYGLRPMIYSSIEAFRITKNKKYLDTAVALASWFFGQNVAQQIMYDSSTGRTYDGIQSAIEVNTNAGAESTIEGLLSMQAIESVPEAKNKLVHFLENKSNSKKAFPLIK